MTNKKTKIVIASVLKPVDDVRNYEKLACSLAKVKTYELFVMGTMSDEISSSQRVTPLPWPPFRRLSFGRLAVQWRYIRMIQKVKPKLIIVTTHELLLGSILYQIFFRTKVVYDVQEDYFKNLIHQHFYPAIVRIPLAYSIRLVEKIAAPFMSHFLLAEEVYATDISFVKRRNTVLDNKSLPIISKEKSEEFKVVFTGTISDYSQAAESIELYLKISPAFPQSAMTVIGYCPSPNYRKMLEKKYRDTIQLKLADRPVPHAAIVDEMATAHLAIIGYAPNPVNERKVPTKQYEYTVAKLPYLVRKHTHWSQVGAALGSAIAIDFDAVNPMEVRELFDAMHPKSIPHAAAEWKANEDILLNTVSKIIGE